MAIVENECIPMNATYARQGCVSKLSQSKTSLIFFIWECSSEAERNPVKVIVEISKFSSPASDVL